MGKAFIPVVPLQTPRAVAVRALLQRERGAGFIEPLLERELDGIGLPAADRALCHELALGCVRWQGALDWLVARRTHGREQKVQVRVLLRLGLYQLLWLDRVPPHAAVHESVQLARAFGCGPQSGFVNALLRGYAREIEATRALLDDLKTSNPAVGLSHPAWLVDRWLAGRGREGAVALMEWNNQPASVFARANLLVAEPGKLLERWRNEGVDYDFVQRGWLPDNVMFRLRSHPPLTRLGSFRDGWFYIQDPSTLLAPLLLDPQPGETVLDLCAAPGGKATFMAQLMRNEGRLLACDASEKRLERVRENCARLGVTCVDVHAQPPGSPAPSPPQFDRVLIDAPCSNTGVMRRRVDLRWRIKPEEIQRLARTQQDLLCSAAPWVKPGGCLVFSTCSLEPEENGEVVRRFVAESADFDLEDEQQVDPVRDAFDGAYAAALKRTA